MKVSILTNSLTPYRIPLFEALSQSNGISCLRLLVCSEKEADRDWDIHTPNLFINLLFGFSLTLKRKGGLFRFLHFRFGIIWELLYKRPDVLIIGDASWTSYIGAVTCQLLRIKYVVWNEITSVAPVSTGLMSSIRKNFFSRSCFVIASCELAKSFVKGFGIPEFKLSIVNNSVDNKTLRSLNKNTDKEQLKLSLNISDNDTVFIYVGQLNSNKRVVDILDVFLLNDDPTKKLIVVGSGPLEKNVLKKISDKNMQDKIIFLGSKCQRELVGYYSISNCLLLVSEFDAWGMVVNEAIVFGLDFVCTDTVAAAAEFHKKNQWGTIFKYEKNDFIDIINNYNKKIISYDDNIIPSITGMKEEMLTVINNVYRS
ncbi:glycosyltransferase family 4 protein [Vibrio splendidus]